MPRKYTYEDVNTQEKPRIRKGEFRVGLVVYEYKCTGRTSVGYGVNLWHAYRAWERNWRRRLAFYGARRENALAYLGVMRRVK